MRYAQPFAPPRGLLSRATLLGRVRSLDAEESAEVRQLFATAHRTRSGVDALRDDDVFLRLDVDRLFFAGGLGTVRR